MAKQVTPFGGHFTGRLGTAVGAKLKGGEYIARSYQPQVKNPNTYRQASSRFRFSLVSSIAAELAEVIKIGYGKATSSTKMYPRNMFVRDLMSDTNTLITDGVTFDSLQVDGLQVSRRDGFSVAPQFQYTAPAGGEDGQIRLTNATDFAVNPDEAQLGIVVVAILHDNSGGLTVTRIFKGQATVGVTVTAADVAAMASCTLLGFAKAIPVSGNSVPTDEWPWKYPSATSKTAVVATIS